MLKEESRYKPRRFEHELFKISPQAYYLYKSKQIANTCKPYSDCHKLHIERKVRKDGVHYWVYNKRGQLIKKGVEK